MGVAALVIGIVSLVFGFIPFCNIFALIPATVGLVLGIIDWVKKKKGGEPKGKAIAGAICSGVAIIIILVYYFAVVLVVNKATNKAAEDLKDWADKTDWSSYSTNYDYNYDYDY